MQGSSLNWTYLTEFDVEAVRALLICDAPRLALGLVRAEQSRDDQNQRMSTLQTTRLPESLKLVQNTAKRPLSSSCDAGLSPVRRTGHLELLSLCVLWDAEQL